MIYAPLVSTARAECAANEFRQRDYGVSYVYFCRKAQQSVRTEIQTKLLQRFVIFILTFAGREASLRRSNVVEDAKCGRASTLRGARSYASAIGSSPAWSNAKVPLSVLLGSGSPG